MRFALGIEYNGTDYRGWQKQPTPSTPSVQATLELALSTVANENITVTCAGRTDAGVHATVQVVHFDTDVERPDTAWVLGVNRLLPAAVSVRWVVNVPDDFHARYSARQRRYIYLIYQDRLRRPLLDLHLTRSYQSLNTESMQQAANQLIGEHDFSAFRSSHCQAKTPVRVLKQLDIHQQGAIIALDFSANAFLHHMVRNIVGTLIEVGNGKQSVGWVAEVLASKDRRQAGEKAPATGLYLVNIEYPPEYNLPIKAVLPINCPIIDSHL